MQVEDGLSGTRANVQYCSISLLNIALACDPRGGQVAFPNNLGIF